MSHNMWRATLLGSAVFLAGFEPAGAVSKSCAERINEVQARADGITRSPRKASALSQLDTARAKLAAGQEDECLLYVRSAESSVEEHTRDGRD